MTRFGRMLRQGTIGAVILTAGSILPLPGALAATIPVTTTADGGAGSLGAAFGTANTNGQDDEIVLTTGAIYELAV